MFLRFSHSPKLETKISVFFMVNEWNEFEVSFGTNICINKETRTSETYAVSRSIDNLIHKIESLVFNDLIERRNKDTVIQENGVWFKIGEDSYKCLTERDLRQIISSIKHLMRISKSTEDYIFKNY